MAQMTRPRENISLRMQQEDCIWISGAKEEEKKTNPQLTTLKGEGFQGEKAKPFSYAPIKSRFGCIILEFRLVHGGHGIDSLASASLMFSVVLC